MAARTQRLPVTQMAQGIAQTCAQLGQVRCGETQLRRTTLTRRSLGQRGGNRRDTDISAQSLIQRVADQVQLGLKGSAIRSAEHTQFNRPVLGADRCILAPAGAVLLEHRMEIGTAETEGRHRSPARTIGLTQPWPRLLEQIGRRSLVGDHIDRIFDPGMARQNPVMQRQCGLDQPGHTGRALGVAYQGLD